MTTVGLDYSLTAPALAVLSLDGQLHHTQHWANQPIHSSHTHRTIWLAKEITTAILKFNPKTVWIEDYAFSANGRITAIAEGVGVLKSFLVTNGVEVVPVPISTWKKALTDNGRATKDQVLQAVNEKFNLNLTGRKGEQDIADAIGVAYYAYCAYTQGRR